MDEGSASRTALVTALMRARHTRLDPVPLLDDPWGDRLVPPTVRDALRERALAAMTDEQRAAALAAPERIVDDHLRSVPAYANVILRSRYAEDVLAAAVEAGVRQYVLIGAGFDSFSLRRPAFAREVAVYEVDHPATQNLKLRRLAECGVAPPAGTHFVAADLAREDLGTALARAAYRDDRPAFFSWLGVSMYLPRAANLASLRAVARCAAPGSELVFTYLDERVFAAGSASEGFHSLQKAVATISEPFVSGFAPATLAAELQRLGLELLEDLDGPALVRRCDPRGANGFACTEASHIARARVAPAKRSAGT